MKIEKEEKKELLKSIHSVEDFRQIPDKDMPSLANEIREFLIDTVSKTGGHLASNLGVVELTMAIHRVFDTPNDHVIFDVGHQSYVHKMLTGRLDAFDTLRKPGGLSGFTRMDESEFDAFGTGHSSTSISASIGFATADKLQGKENTTVCVIGDGALTGGLALEGINNCKKDLPLVIILNENEMSISNVTGSFPKLISKIRVSDSYNNFKTDTKKVLSKVPLVGKPLSSAVSGTKEAIRQAFYKANFFEEMGIAYLGPVDGNDYFKVKGALEIAKEKKSCVIVHVKTQKGKGYEPAEKNPMEFHSVAKENSEEPHFFTKVGEVLCNLAKEDPSIVAITPATGYSSGLSSFQENFPDRYFDVGIAEEHAVTFAAGLSCAGLKPYAVIYSSFLQRAYDEILHDVALQKLPVRFLIDRAGLSSGDGATHHGIYDVSFLLPQKEIALLAPICFGTLEEMLKRTQNTKTPIAIRYPNAEEDKELIEAFYPSQDFTKYGVRSYGNLHSAKTVFISYGQITREALHAAKELKDGAVILVEDLRDEKSLMSALDEVKPGAKVVFLEEGIKIGGYSQMMVSVLGTRRTDLTYKILAIEDGSQIPPENMDYYQFFNLTKNDCLWA